MHLCTSTPENLRTLHNVQGVAELLASRERPLFNALLDVREAHARCQDALATAASECYLGMCGGHRLYLPSFALWQPRHFHMPALVCRS